MSLYKTLFDFSFCTGYDIDGAKDLAHELIGTKKWIGTAGMFLFI